MELRDTPTLSDALFARLSAIPALAVPDEVHATLDARGLRWQEGAPDGVEDLGPLAFPLIWVGTQWDRGLEHIRAIENRAARERTILIGRDPPSDIGPRLRAAGALTYAKADVPGWLLPPVQAALLRLQENRMAQWWPAMHERQEPAPHRAVETLLTLAKLAADLLGATDWDVLVRKHRESQVCRLSHREGHAFLIPWREGSHPDPTPFFDAANRFGGQVVLPCLDHAASLANDARVPASEGGAIATIFHAGHHWRSAILLRWRTPFLPNPTEIAALESFSWVAAAAWTQFGLPARPTTGQLAAFVRCASESKGRMVPERALLRMAAEIMGAASAFLILRDTEEPPPRLYFACAWDHEPAADREAAPCQGLHVACPDNSEEWRALIDAELRASGVDPAGISQLLLPSAKDGTASGVVVLSFAAGGRPRSVGLKRDLEEEAAAELLEYGWPLVELLAQRHARDSADALAATAPSETPGDIGLLLRHAASIVLESTGAEEVFAVYGSEAVGLPIGGDSVAIEAGAASITALARRRNATLRILALDDTARELPRRHNAKGTRQLLAALNWGGLRSMIACPIDHGRGMLKVYTSSNGAFLTPSDASVVSVVGDRFARLAAPLHYQAALRELNATTSKLACLSGEQLASQLIAALEHWSNQYLRAGSIVYVLARHGSGPVLTAGSKERGAPSAEDVAASYDQVPRPTAMGAWKITCADFSIADAHGLSGALLLLHKRDLGESSQMLLREAAREVAVLLYAESARQELYHQLGILRHGLLGPAQGLMSNALFLAHELKERGISSADIVSSTRTIQRDSDKISMWRTENRLVASLQRGGRLEIRRRRSELRPFVEACVDRFRGAVAERNLSLGLDLPQGGVHASFDEESLDVALSNLLDNAVKYAFFNREVKVGIHMHRRAVGIWVEDVGHGIPEELRDAIYEPGHRVGQHDRFRVIRGEGLGLYLVRRIAEAHEGTLSHTSHLEGRVVNDKTPYRVRFTFELGGD